MRVYTNCASYSAPSLDILNSASFAPIFPIMEPASIASFTERSLAVNLNPNDAFTFDDMFSRSYAGNVILLALPTELIPILLLMRLILENLFLILKQLNQTLILTIISSNTPWLQYCMWKKSSMQRKPKRHMMI